MLAATTRRIVKHGQNISQVFKRMAGCSCFFKNKFSKMGDLLNEFSAMLG